MFSHSSMLGAWGNLVGSLSRSSCDSQGSRVFLAFSSAMPDSKPRENIVAVLKDGVYVLL